MNVQIGEVEID